MSQAGSSVLLFVALCLFTGIGLSAEPGQPPGVDGPGPFVVRPAGAPQPDQLCQMLFDAYLKGGKIETEMVTAAETIVAKRGHDVGFWKTVLAELQKGNPHSEESCVRVLGKMLAIDSWSREATQRQKETGQPIAMPGSVTLGPEVVRELVARGKRADRFRADNYVIALAQAKLPDTIDFFRTILLDDTVRPAETARLYAAIGLAQLGDPQGFEWLITAATDYSTTASIDKSLPWNARSGNLNHCAAAALQQLSEKKDLQTQNEWKDWWTALDKRSLPKRTVHIRDLR